MRRAGFVAGALLCAAACVAQAAPTMSRWAYEFTDSVGMNIHLRHARSFYDLEFARVKQLLLAARIRHVRDGAMDLNGGFFERDRAERFRELGEAGIRVTFIFRPMVTREFVQGFPARVQPAFEAYELPNEFNLQQALPWAEVLREWMPVFAGYVRTGTESARHPILGPSIADLGGDPHLLLGDRSDDLDFGNLHKYYRAFPPSTSGYGRPGRPPCEAVRYGALPYAMCQVRRISAGKPIICTEAGYTTKGSAERSVTPEVQARYLARMLMLHLKAGIPRTFIYQMVDHGTDEGAGMGLLDADGAEKPAWRQLRALMHEFNDTRPNSAAPSLDVSLSGELENLETLLFAKADRSYRLVLWLETPSYDPEAGRELDVAPQEVLLTLPREFQIRSVMTFDESGAATQRRLAGSSRRLTIDDNLSIVEIVR
jgi:hypothetical protein